MNGLRRLPKETYLGMDKIVTCVKDPAVHLRHSYSRTSLYFENLLSRCIRPPYKAPERGYVSITTVLYVHFIFTMNPALWSIIN